MVSYLVQDGVAPFGSFDLGAGEAIGISPEEQMATMTKNYDKIAIII